MKLDPGMHIGLHLVFFGETGVTVLYRWTVNFYRSCVGLGWLAQETTRFILVWASEE
jgi:hypothetical protein